MTIENIKAQKIYINSEPTELYKILKFEGMVSTGGEAKTVIANGLVYVNNQLEFQKRKKIMSGDTIHFHDRSYVIFLAK